jgi:hypothetical protein
MVIRIRRANRPILKEPPPRLAQGRRQDVPARAEFAPIDGRDDGTEGRTALRPVSGGDDSPHRVEDDADQTGPTCQQCKPQAHQRHVAATAAFYAIAHRMHPLLTDASCVAARTTTGEVRTQPEDVNFPEILLRISQGLSLNVRACVN